MTIVLVAHGTRDAAGQALTRELAAAVSRQCDDRPVRLAFVDVLGPSVREAVRAADGPVTVVPAFLAAGYHVRADIPAELAAAGRADVTVAAPLGPHPAVVAAAADRLRAAGWDRGDAVVLAAAGSSDERAIGDVRRAGRLLGRELGRRVRVGFAAAASPNVDTVIRGLRAGGARRVAVASWLLAPGFFHRKLAASGADLVSEPIGVDAGVIDRLVTLGALVPIARTA